jgi:CheY-like chemotaxis protein
MKTPHLPHSLMRQELEESWRARVEAAHTQYQAASKQYRELMQGRPDGLPPNKDDAVALAREAESYALAEYTRVLHIFSELTAQGKMPEEEARGKFGREFTGLGLALISIVDDDESIRAATKGLLRSAGYEVQTFASADLFLESGALRETECLILDIRMPGIDGLELQRRLNVEECHVPVIFVTAHDDQTNRRKALDAGALAVFHKPFDAHELVAAIQSALDGREEQEI